MSAVLGTKSRRILEGLLRSAWGLGPGRGGQMGTDAVAFLCRRGTWPSTGVSEPAFRGSGTSLEQVAAAVPREGFWDTRYRSVTGRNYFNLLRKPSASSP